MVSQLTIGLNSYVTSAEADTYLANSIRAASTWLSVAPDTKVAALISAFRLFEKQYWSGTATGITKVTAVSIAAGGSGYAVNDILTIDGGTFGDAATVQVLTVSTGAVATVALLNAGTYSASPGTTNAATGGSGSSVSLTLTLGDQSALHPRSGMSDCDGQAIDSLALAEDLKSGQIELAYELTQDTSLESASNTGSNVKQVGAGSAQVAFFRPTSGSGESSRFPNVVMELIRCLTGSSAGIAGPTITGTTATSSATACDDELTEGFA